MGTQEIGRLELVSHILMLCFFFISVCILLSVPFFVLYTFLYSLSRAVGSVGWFSWGYWVIFVIISWRFVIVFCYAIFR